MSRQALLCLALAACVSHEDALVTGTQSLRIELVTPANPGTPQAPLPDGTTDVTVNVTAIDAEGNVDTTFNNDVSVYVQYLGTLTPYIDQPPLQTIKMTAGMATNQTVKLPLVYGPTTVWFDDSRSAEPTYATGTSPTLWFRDPHIYDIQHVDENNVGKFEVSPLENKQVTIDSSQYATGGTLIVTSVFAQGYTVSDSQCGASGPCTTGPYQHAMVFSFSAPRDQDGNFIREGQTISGFAGGVQEFNGLTEIGFPQTFVYMGAGQDFSARMPVPAVLDTSWFTSPNNINFERNEAAPIEIDDAMVCPLDADYETYKQWKIDPAGMCTPGSKNLINVITTGVVPLDVANCVGKTLPRVVGVLRPVSIGTFNVWIIYPRGSKDLTLPAGDAQCKFQ